EVVRCLLRARRGNGEDADDDVLFPYDVGETIVRRDFDVAHASADLFGIRVEDRSDVDPVLGEDRAAGDRLAQAAGADQRDVVLALSAQDLADLAEQGVDVVADAALAEFSETRE